MGTKINNKLLMKHLGGKMNWSFDEKLINNFFSVSGNVKKSRELLQYEEKMDY